MTHTLTVRPVTVGWYVNRSGHPRIVTEVGEGIGLVRFVIEDGSTHTITVEDANDQIEQGRWVRQEEAR